MSLFQAEGKDRLMRFQMRVDELQKVLETERKGYEEKLAVFSEGRKGDVERWEAEKQVSVFNC